MWAPEGATLSLKNILKWCHLSQLALKTTSLTMKKRTEASSPDVARSSSMLEASGLRPPERHTWISEWTVGGIVGNVGTSEEECRDRDLWSYRLNCPSWCVYGWSTPLKGTCKLSVLNKLYLCNTKFTAKLCYRSFAGGCRNLQKSWGSWRSHWGQITLGNQSRPFVWWIT